MEARKKIRYLDEGTTSDAAKTENWIRKNTKKGVKLVNIKCKHKRGKRN